jgi:Mg2+/citrate symporter
MKDLLIPLAIVPLFSAVSIEDISLWERLIEKWGIVFTLFIALAWWTTKRETDLQNKRDIREADNQEERLNLLKRNNELQEQQLEQHKKHSEDLKRIIRDGNKYQADVGIELKNLARRIRCPGSILPPES